MDSDYEDYQRWKREKEEGDRKRGDYWISPEGRAEIRDIWGYGYKHYAGDVVTPLLNALEALEKATGVKATTTAPPV